ncbi:retrovirus-related Pol polyprotein from transposon TNT 1-94, partial [Trifolium medium]|nr:retrovirus-related Pol polyprotein from transposon TNT 1-94 [Trifolium medium]
MPEAPSMDSGENSNSDSPLRLPQTSKDSTKTGLTHSLTIKLDEKNFLLWSQQVNGVITAHNLHRFVLNPQIPLQFDSIEARSLGQNSEAYQQWLVKDQTLFTWLLSTLSDSVLPRVLSCRHAYEVWDKIHKYFNSVFKSRARQLRSELKNTKKLARSINEYLLRIKTFVNSLIAVGDVVSEQEQLRMWRLYFFKQELSAPSVYAHLAHADSKSNESVNDNEASDHGTEHYYVNAQRGKGKGKNRGKGKGKAPSQPQGKVLCQICGKPNHDAVKCWYRYDPNPVRAPQFNPYMRPSAHLAMPHYYAPNTDVESMASASWYPDSGASHHLTYNPNNLMYNTPYNGQEQGSNQVLLEGTVGSDGLYQFKSFKFLTNSGDSKSGFHLSNFPAFNNHAQCNSSITTITPDNEFHKWHLSMDKSHRLYAPRSTTVYSHPFEALQSDWGGEFRPFTELLNKLGIQHRLTCPHTSHQNGTVERKHRQIVEMGLTLLSHAALPLKFWDHSFTQAVFLINKLPSSVIPQFSSPHHALFKSQPDYSQVK